MELANPKRHGERVGLSAGRLYPYYAGFSAEFVRSCLRSLDLPPSAEVLDPWNGSGTTTSVAATFPDIFGLGLDLNPVMVVVAKAQLLGRDVTPSLRPLAREITDSMSEVVETEDDPLRVWFKNGTATVFRKLEQAVSSALVPATGRDLTSRTSVSQLSSLASFYYLALFRSVRKSLRPLVPSNPTWIRVPNPKDRISLTEPQIVTNFWWEIELMSDAKLGGAECSSPRFGRNQVEVIVDDARGMSARSHTRDVVIGSPPYCTRIDYAITTRPELAVLGIGQNSGFDTLRRSLTGTVVTREGAAIVASDEWGKKCLNTIDSVGQHASKASKGYYLKQFLQYFSDLYPSLNEIRRVLRPGGACILVVQDSLYKEIHVDLPSIVLEMADNIGLKLSTRNDFKLARSLRYINSRSRQYRVDWNPTESVLAFTT